MHSSVLPIYSFHPWAASVTEVSHSRACPLSALGVKQGPAGSSRLEPRCTVRKRALDRNVVEGGRISRLCLVDTLRTGGGQGRWCL